MSDAPIEILVSDIAVEVIVGGVPGSGVVESDRESAEEFPIATAAGSYELTLAHTPIPDSVIVWWGGFEQDTFTLDGDVVTVLDPDGLTVAGDALAVDYRWRPLAPAPIIPDPPVPAEITYIGTTTDLNSSVTSIALPDGTEEGDLLVISITEGGFAPTAPSCLDPRISYQYQPPLYLGGARKLVGFGYADASLDPIVCHVSDPESNGKVQLTTYRVAGAVSHVSSSDFFTTANVPVTPAMPTGTPEKGVMVLAWADSGGDTETVVDGWTRDSFGSSTNQRNSAWSCQTGVPAFTLPHTAVEWCAITIGVSDA